MLSYAWSLRRSPGSQPPTRTLPPALSRFGKRGARSRSAGGSRFSQRSGGSVICESAEIRCSRPIVASVSRATATSLSLGNGMASSIPTRYSILSGKQSTLGTARITGPSRDFGSECGRSARRRRWVLEEAAGEDDRVRKDDDASRWSERVTGQLLQLDSYEADLRDLAVHVPEGPLQAHPISHANPVRRDHREVAGNRQDDVLERERDPGRGKAERRHQRRHFAGEVKDQHQRDGDRHDDAPNGQEQTPARRVRHIADHRHPPQHSADEDDGEREDDPNEVQP